MNADIEEVTNDNTVEPSTAVQNNTVLNDALNLNTTSSDHEGSQTKILKEIRNSTEMADLESSLKSNSSLRQDHSNESQRDQNLPSINDKMKVTNE